MLIPTLLSLLILAQGAAKKPAELPLTVPDGWAVEKDDSGRVFEPRKVAEGKFYRVAEPRLAAPAGSLKTLLAAGKAVLGESVTFTPSVESQAAKNGNGWEYQLVIGTLAQGDAKLMAQIIALKKGDDEGILVVVSDSVETMEKHSDALAAVIRSVGASKATFDIWKLAAFDGWTSSVDEKYFALTCADGADFCRIVLWKSRASEPVDPEQEFAREWKEVVEHGWKPGTVTKLKPRRLKSGVVAQGAASDRTDTNGKSCHGALFVVLPYGKVVSIDVVANSAAAFARYDGKIADVLDSLKVDVDAIAKEVAGTLAAPLQPAEVQGKWATSRSGNFDQFMVGLHHGSDCRQYEFRKDGTYTFHLEGWGGSYRSDEYLIMDENGTYAVDGNKLTLTPSAGTTVVQNRKGEVQKKVDPRLETTTYLWQFHFFEGIRENNLVLTPPGETSRDGRFAANRLYGRSYLLSGKYNPEWTKFGK